jgi:hypothetical protein
VPRLGRAADGAIVRFALGQGMSQQRRTGVNFYPFELKISE